MFFNQVIHRWAGQILPSFVSMEYWKLGHSEPK